MRCTIVFEVSGERQQAIIEAADVRRAILMVKTKFQPQRIISVIDQSGKQFDGQGDDLTALN